MAVVRKSIAEPACLVYLPDKRIRNLGFVIGFVEVLHQKLHSLTIVIGQIDLAGLRLLRPVNI